jgi:DNA-directed RNA polymerase specialized sigma24 family protein
MTSWRQQALAHWEMINRMAGRRFQQADLAEEAALFVMDGLAWDDWSRLRAFTGRSTLATYIGALTLRLLEDFARARFGRVKPPLWVRRLGGLWMTLFRLLCLERFSPDEAVAIIANHQPAQIRAAEEAAYHILGELPTCGEHRGEQTEFNEETGLPDSEEECSAQEQQLEEEERRQLFAILGRFLFDDTAAGGDPRLLERVAAAGISLESKERLLLKLCYRDGVAVAEAGRMLGWNRHQVHGRLRRLLERLRQDLANAGLGEELRLLL